MVERKERPRCRKMIESILAEKGLSLKALIDDMDCNRHRYSDGLRTQARRMIEEKGIHGKR